MHKTKFIFLIFCTILHFNPSYSALKEKGLKEIEEIAISNNNDVNGCRAIHKQVDRKDKCEYAKSYLGCQPTSYIPYLQLFYCTFSPLLGYILLIIWLLVLFYLLGDTASSYFCLSLDGLSTTLRLSPTVAGVTLLSLGNGAPDVFDSIISFMGDGDTADIGVNSILGGAFFVSSVVVGVISISVSIQGKKIIYSKNFTWNIIFLLLCLCCLLVIIIFGKINFWGSLGFLSLYFLYVASIFISEAHASRKGNLNLTESSLDHKVPILPIVSSSPDELSDLNVPLLENEQKKRSKSVFRKLVFILGLPFDLPRKLTIPITSEEKWSKPFGVISTLLAPILLATLWNCHFPKQNSQLYYIIGAIIGVSSALLLFCITDSSNPPRKYKFLWLSESFLMSITWIYICAQELVGLMACLGIILGISNSVMGLTVLAWGNSLGDLFTNVTMSKNGGPCGIQMAISGCYAGPIFNIVVGLGLSLGFATWAVYPLSFEIVSDLAIYETFGFLMMGLFWALLVVVKRNVELDKFLGCGLLVIYGCFLFLKLARSLGLLEDSFWH